MYVVPHGEVWNGKYIEPPIFNFALDEREYLADVKPVYSWERNF
jgi:hypothetical protein